MQEIANAFLRGDLYYEKFNISTMSISTSTYCKTKQTFCDHRLQDVLSVDWLCNFQFYVIWHSLIVLETESSIFANENCSKTLRTKIDFFYVGVRMDTLHLTTMMIKFAWNLSIRTCRMKRLLHSVKLTEEICLRWILN